MDEVDVVGCVQPLRGLSCAEAEDTISEPAQYVIMFLIDLAQFAQQRKYVAIIEMLFCRCVCDNTGSNAAVTQNNLIVHAKIFAPIQFRIVLRRW